MRLLSRVVGAALLVAALVPAPLFAQGLLMPTPKQQFFNDAGAVLNGGKLYSYAAGTTTPQATYSDQGLTTPNANPIILDAAGRATVYLSRTVAYKFILKTSADVTVWTQDNVSLPSDIVPPSPDAVPTGTILFYGAATAPTGYLLGNGAAVDRTVYATLYSIIGTAYGAGDGLTTFNVPDCRGRALIGAGTGSGLTARTVGQPLGEETHILTVGEMPSHSHGVTDPGHSHGGVATAFSSTSPFTGSAALYIANMTNTTSSATTGITIQNAGSGTAHNNMQPSLVAGCIIKS